MNIACIVFSILREAVMEYFSLMISLCDHLLRRLPVTNSYAKMYWLDSVAVYRCISLYIAVYRFNVLKTMYMKQCV